MQEIIPLHVDGTPWRGQQDAICWDYSKKVVGREAGLEGQGTSSMLAIPDLAKPPLVQNCLLRIPTSGKRCERKRIAEALKS